MISFSTVNAFELLLANCRRELPALDEDKLLSRAAMLLPTLKAALDFQLPVRSVYALGAAIERVHGVPGRSTFARALIAYLALKQIGHLNRAALPPSVLALYPGAYERLVDYLNENADASYWVGQDAFLKDMRMVGGYSVPCGAQDVDLIGTISKGSGLKAVVKWGEVRKGWTIFRSGGPSWFNIHTDQRYTEDFNEAGWDRCYVRIADLLTLHPDVKGMVGTSWFYDPQIITVSPRLAYLQSNPVMRGAFLIPHGPGAIHTERATQKSSSRRELFEKGKYLPVCYSLVWQRDAMIAWAKK